MADLLSRFLGPVNIANGASTLFTGTAAHVYTIKNISIVNTTGSFISLSLGINGIAAANLILSSLPIDGGGKAEYDGLIIMNGTDTLQANASATGLTITVSGLDQS